MHPVSPSTKTTLVLTASFQPCGFFSARSAIRNLMVGAVKSFGQWGNVYDWENWITYDDMLSDDHPSLRSVSCEWAVPTIVVIPGYFGNHFKNKKRYRNINLRQLYNVYDGSCQYCLKKIPFSQATRDHVLPRSRGGGNSDNNIVLSCKRCNSKKGSHYPYPNAHGHEVRPRILNDIDFSVMSENVKHRPEWSIFLK